MPNQNELEEIVNSVTGASDKNNEETEKIETPETDSQKEEQLAELLDVSVKEQPPQTPADDPNKQKMAKIREALAMVNDSDDDEPEAPVVRPAQHEALPPLKRKVPQTANTASAAPFGTPVKTKTSHPDEAQKSKPKSAKPKAPAKQQQKKNAGKLPLSVYTGSICTAVVLAGLIGYFIVASTYQDKFLPNTMVDAVDVAGMTDKEAQYTLLAQKAVPDLKLTTPKGETVTFSAEDFNAKYSIPEGSFTEAAAENPYAWGGKLFNASEYTVNYQLNYTEWRLRDLINDYDWGDEVSQNAAVIRDGAGDFVIRPETLGDQFDTQILLDYIAEQVAMGRTSLNMEDSGCYESYRAEIKQEDLVKELDLYNNYADCTITFDFEDRKKVIDSDMIVDWIMTDADGAVKKNSDGQIIFDYNEISNFVAKMAAETDTWGKDRTFYATVDGWITVPWTEYPYSTYGWQIDQEGTINQIITLMREGETVTVEPQYNHRGYVRGEDDIGTTYVEADISEQHLWVYINNEIVFDCDFVSGTETDPGRRTPRGICQILYKEAGRYLGTYEVQGYRTWVDYWMPFNNWGCGFHDLSRGAYGGSIYMYNGSHGCLNLSWSNAKTMFNTIETGMPCIVHD